MANLLTIERNINKEKMTNLHMKEAALVYLDRSGGLQKFIDDCKYYNGMSARRLLRASGQASAHLSWLAHLYLHRFKTKLRCLSVQYFNKPLWCCRIRCRTWKSHFAPSLKSCSSFSISKLKKKYFPHHMENFSNLFAHLKSQVCFVAVKTLSLIGQLQTETQVSVN